MKLKKQLIEFWHRIPENERKEHISHLESILNYFVNSVLISIPFYFFSLFFFEGSFLRYVLILISFWIILPFFEYYYVWLKEDWKYFKRRD